MCKKTILYIILVFILLFNMVLPSLVEPYCSGVNDVSNTSRSYFYTGFQDGVAYLNNNPTNASLTKGVQSMDYDLTNEDGVCKKYGFEQGYSMYSDEKEKQKTEVLDKRFSFSHIIDSIKS